MRVRVKVRVRVRVRVSGAQHGQDEEGEEAVGGRREEATWLGFGFGFGFGLGFGLGLGLGFGLDRAARAGERAHYNVQ